MKAEKRKLLEAPLDVARAQRHAIGFAALALVAAFSMLHGPDIQVFQSRAAPVAHFIIGLLAIAVATHVISVAWSGLSDSASAAANALVFCFGIVAGANLIHFLMHEGGQFPAISPNDAAAAWLWLVGAVFHLAAMLMLYLRLSWPGTRVAWLQASLWVACAMAFAAGVADTGVASPHVERTAAAVLTMANWLIAAGFWSRFKRSKELWYLGLVLSCFLSGMAAFLMGRYTPATGTVAMVSDMVIDMLKLASYACLYRALFVNGLQGPLRRLASSETALRERESELRDILENLPAGLCRLDERLHFRYANRKFGEVMHIAQQDLAGKAMDALVPKQHLPMMARHLERVRAGDKVEFDFVSAGGDDSVTCHRHVILAPVLQDDGASEGVLVIVSDVSAREHALLKAAASAQEVLELKAALDAHAIVAVTDARGVITQVNDKFCSISQYGRDELVGKTHRVINSAYHPKGFFAAMWSIISRGEVWSGEVCNRARDGSLYWVQTTIVPLLGRDGFPLQYIAIRADITKRKEAEAEAHRMALHDALTGLPNRRLMGDRLTHALATARRERQYGGLLFLDMDNFKDVNDSLGHPVGDQLLRQVAIRISESVRQNDTVARLGGDEFVVILEKIGVSLETATTNALEVANSVREELSKTFSFGSNTVNTSPSIGIVLFRDEELPDELVKQADIALYKAKEEGRNRVAFFNPQLQATINERALLLNALRNAIPGDELRLFYQPVVDASMKIVGVEALIRWEHGELGLVSPAQFIPLAEQSNLIISVGEWVLRTACNQLKAWHSDRVKREWTVAVNVSAKQFHDVQFVSCVCRHLEATGAPAGKLRIEITESSMQVDVEQTIVKMKALRALGVRFSLDDFGTGYSSLSYLKRLPLDQLKIDRSFVSDVNVDASDAAIVRTILSLAEHLHLDVVAEGVETLAQKQLLLSHGCPAFQGYHFGRPVPVEMLGNQI